MHDLENYPRSNVSIPIESQQASSHLLTIAIFVISVTVCEILTVNICRSLNLICIMDQGQM